MKKSNIKESLMYLIVGGIATVAEWVLFFVLDKISVHHTLATIIAYFLSTFVNWFAGRIFVFKGNQQSVLKKILGIYIDSLVGLLMNLVIM
jgi:putative flippase GtrA